MSYTGTERRDVRGPPLPPVEDRAAPPAFVIARRERHAVVILAVAWVLIFLGLIPFIGWLLTQR